MHILLVLKLGEAGELSNPVPMEMVMFAPGQMKDFYINLTPINANAFQCSDNGMLTHQTKKETHCSREFTTNHPTMYCRHRSGYRITLYTRVQKHVIVTVSAHVYV